MKLCIIGAGVSGLCSIKRAIEYGCDVIAFEQTAEIGGTWILRDEIGKDKYGLDVHSSMYKGLTTDIPKEVMCYPDFPYPTALEHSYIPSMDVLKYLNDYAREFGLVEKIKFEHNVVRVRPLAENKWEVIVRDLKDDKFYTYEFDAVLVCTGNFHTPHWPHFSSQDLFLGKLIHSHDFRDAEPFSNEKVLLIGAGPTGIDLVKVVAKTAEAVTWSTHSKFKLNIQLADNVNLKPDVLEFMHNGAVFADGTREKFSMVLYCTGYKHSFPFLSVDCGVLVEENYVSPLYMHCLSIERPTLCFIGLPTVVCNNQAFDYQARFCLKFMTKQLTLPTRDKMLRDWQQDMDDRWTRGLTKRRAHMMGFEIQEKYFADLSDIAEIEPVKPVIMKMFNKSILNLFADLNSYREKKFKAVDDEAFEEF